MFMRRRSSSGIDFVDSIRINVIQMYIILQQSDLFPLISRCDLILSWMEFLNCRIEYNGIASIAQVITQQISSKIKFSPMAVPCCRIHDKYFLSFHLYNSMS